MAFVRYPKTLAERQALVGEAEVSRMPPLRVFRVESAPLGYYVADNGGYNVLGWPGRGEKFTDQATAEAICEKWNAR